MSNHALFEVATRNADEQHCAIEALIRMYMEFTACDIQDIILVAQTDGLNTTRYFVEQASKRKSQDYEMNWAYTDRGEFITHDSE